MPRFRDTSDDDTGAAGIDISPLMDCVFILLIFFIVTTTFVEETGVEVDKPSSSTPTQLEKTSVLIAVTDKGEVIYGGSKIGISGVRNVVKRALEGEQEPVPVIIQADQTVETGLLVRVIDQAKLGGALKVSIATRKAG